eukprot:m.106120 g.106120  ORF g.106120 m.106120 type:complete len:79 (+) comp10574_c0_seq4:1383-1619(+)
MHVSAATDTACIRYSTDNGTDSEACVRYSTDNGTDDAADNDDGCGPALDSIANAACGHVDPLTNTLFCSTTSPHVLGG